MATLEELWVFLRGFPLFWLFMTLLGYRFGFWVNAKMKGSPWFNPIVVANVTLISFLVITGVDYATYFTGGQYIHLLLGPATVALAVPLYANLSRLARALGPLSLTLIIGSTIGIVAGVALGASLGLEREILLTLGPRSVTTPIAMGIAEQTGGIPQLAAAFVILTGIIGCLVSIPLIQRLGWDSDLVLGFSTGLAAHGIGTARVFQLSETAGAFAGLAMGLNGLLTAVLIPILLGLFPI